MKSFAIVAIAIAARMMMSTDGLAAEDADSAIIKQMWAMELYEPPGSSPFVETLKFHCLVATSKPDKYEDCFEGALKLSTEKDEISGLVKSIDSEDADFKQSLLEKLQTFQGDLDKWFRSYPLLDRT